MDPLPRITPQKRRNAFEQLICIQTADNDRRRRFHNKRHKERKRQHDQPYTDQIHLHYKHRISTAADDPVLVDIWYDIPTSTTLKMIRNVFAIAFVSGCRSRKVTEPGSAGRTAGSPSRYRFLRTASAAVSRNILPDPYRHIRSPSDQHPAAEDAPTAVDLTRRNRFDAAELAAIAAAVICPRIAVCIAVFTPKVRL